MSHQEVFEHQAPRVSVVHLGRVSPRKHLRPMPNEAVVQVRSLADIVAARRRGRELAAQLGFSNCDLTVIVTAISEIARNTVEHASGGDVIITPFKNGGRKGLKVVITDQGPGIADIPRVMRDGYSSGNGLGIGLPGTRRLMDEFEITSHIGKGTTVTMKKWAA